MPFGGSCATWICLNYIKATILRIPLIIYQGAPEHPGVFGLHNGLATGAPS